MSEPEPLPQSTLPADQGNQADKAGKPRRRKWRVGSWRWFAVVGSLVATITLGVVATYVGGWLDHNTNLGPESLYVGEVGVSQSADSVTPSNEYGGGWGPERDTFTGEHPASYAVLNSITDRTSLGDERYFARVKNLTTNQSFAHETSACPGEVVKVYAYFENDAADNLASSSATIHGLTERVATGNQGTNSVAVGVVFDAKNATSVWDGGVVNCDSSAIRLTYIPGTARLTTNFTPSDGIVLSDDGFSGAKGLIGAKAADGELPVGFENGSYLGEGNITFNMLVTAA